MPHAIKRNGAPLTREQQNEIIRRRFTTGCTEQIARDLGVTNATVRSRAQRMGLRRCPKRTAAMRAKSLRGRRRSDDEQINRAIADMYRTHTNSELAAKLGLTYNSVVSRAKRMQLSSQRLDPSDRAARKAAQAAREYALSRLDINTRRVLASQYATTCNHQLAAHMAMTVAELQFYARALRLRKCPTYLRTARVYTTPVRPVPDHMLQARHS